ncbi:hypothetical protein [Haloarchaeobius iranensis]|uniref:Uncharacterized protein n=1 Tax=Haloarchaeobius iranensis TaxID=996166 RepID=A0A1G9VJG5_9EURY|nr:hypothetical protein [Haloarchaeobius iranensis]SDM72237.1 hypothetical protein SAMN05192554_106143 [Haloarchaeobius iranensis]
MPARRRILQTLAGAGVASLAGCSVGGEFHDFEADNRRDQTVTVLVAWDGQEERFALDAGESVSRRDLLPDGDTGVVVTAGDTEGTVAWTGDGPTLFVEIGPDGIQVGTYYDD